MKALLSKNEVFADACNQYFFHGNKVVKPEELVELDPTEIALPYGKISGEANTNQKYRDILKLCTVKADTNCTYCIFGIEAQSNIHYAMPVRNLLYDALHLTKQVTEIAREHNEHRKSKGGKKAGISADEYLSGFYKTDKITPVLTLVVYLGEKEWDGPRSLREMYAKVDQEFLHYAMDYKLHLLDLSHLANQELERFCNDLFQVATFVKYADSGKELVANVAQNERFIHVSREAIDVVQSFTKYRFETEDGKEGNDVCKGLIELKEEGRAEGKIEAVQDILQKLLSGGASEEDLQRMLSVTPEEFNKMLRREPVEV